MYIDAILLAVAILMVVFVIYKTFYVNDLKSAPEPNLAEELKPGYFNLLARKAGFSSRELLPWYWFYKILFSVAFAAFAQPHLIPLVVFAVAIVGFVLPDVFLYWMSRTRRLLIINGLSFYLDLVISLLHSGFPVNRAFLYAAKRAYSRRHPLAQEIAQVGREWQLGETDGEAFSRLAARTKISEFELIAMSLNLGAKYGAPFSETLTAQSKLIREKRRNHATKRIQTAMLKVTFAVMLCGLPLFFVVLFYPLVRNVSELLSYLGDAF